MAAQLIIVAPVYSVPFAGHRGPEGGGDCTHAGHSTRPTVAAAAAYYHCQSLEGSAVAPSASQASPGTSATGPGAGGGVAGCGGDSPLPYSATPPHHYPSAPYHHHHHHFASTGVGYHPYSYNYANNHATYAHAYSSPSASPSALELTRRKMISRSPSWRSGSPNPWEMEKYGPSLCDGASVRRAGVGTGPVRSRHGSGGARIGRHRTSSNWPASVDPVSRAT